MLKIRHLKVNKMAVLMILIITTFFYESEEQLCPLRNEMDRCCNGYMKVNGTCTECPSGKFGTNCRDVCADGYYGLLCKNVCNCSRSQTCNRETGCTAIVNTDEEIDLSGFIYVFIGIGASIFLSGSYFAASALFRKSNWTSLSAGNHPTGNNLSGITESIFMISFRDDPDGQLYCIPNNGSDEKYTSLETLDSTVDDNL